MPSERRPFTHLEVCRGGKLPPVVSVAWPDPLPAMLARLPRPVPVWWLRLDGFFGPPTVIRPLADIAAAFADELTRKLPDGPVHLVGFSVGGLIAADLANRLQAAGRGVRSVLVEPPVPGHLPTEAKLRRRARARVRESAPAEAPARAESPPARALRHLRALGRMWPWEWVDYLRPRAADDARRLRRWLRVRLESGILGRYREERLRPWLDGLVRQGLTVPRRHRQWWYYFPQLHRRVVQYTPPRYTTPVHLTGWPDWLAAHAPVWQYLVEPGNLFLCELPDAQRGHHDAVREAPSRAWLDVVRGWYEADPRQARLATGGNASLPAGN